MEKRSRSYLEKYVHMEGMEMVDSLTDEDREYYTKLAKEYWGEEKFEAFSEEAKKIHIYREVAKEYFEDYTS